MVPSDNAANNLPPISDKKETNFVLKDTLSQAIRIFFKLVEKSFLPAALNIDYVYPFRVNKNLMAF